MGRRSKVRQLPAELRKELDRLLADDRHTHAQIANHLRQLGAEVSESAVQRYGVKFQSMTKMARLAREAATTLARDLHDDESPAMGRLVVESLQGLLFVAQGELAQAAEAGHLDPTRLSSLSACAKDLAYALKSSTDTEIRIRDRALKEAASRVKTAAQSMGLSEATINMVKARIMGLPT